MYIERCTHGFGRGVRKPTVVIQQGGVPLLDLIFRLVYEHAKSKKPVQRLWIISLEESAIKEGLANLRPGADYDKLYKAALCRNQSDWIVGMNFSRLFSINYNIKLNVGRVQTPTLAMVVEQHDSATRSLTTA